MSAISKTQPWRYQQPPETELRGMLRRQQPTSDVRRLESQLEDSHDGIPPIYVDLNDRNATSLLFQRNLGTRNLGTDGFARCGAPQPTIEHRTLTAKVQAEWEAKNRNNNRNLAVKKYNIKVYWHIMQKGPGLINGAFPKKKVKAAMAQLNQSFANTPFNFVLSGTTRTIKPQWFNCIHSDSLEKQYKTALRKPGTDVLNIFMCDVLGSQGQWGNAWLANIVRDYPEYDGVTVSTPYPKNKPVIDTYMTVVHEVGHWLGLYHTFEGGCSPAVKTHDYDKSYIFAGDGITDTAAHTEDTWQYDGFLKCFQGYRYNTCPDNIPGVDPGFDPVLNQMNYVDSPCGATVGEFTPGQVRRMLAQFETFRLTPGTEIASQIKKKKKKKRKPLQMKGPMKNMMKRGGMRMRRMK